MNRREGSAFTISFGIHMIILALALTMNLAEMQGNGGKEGDGGEGNGEADGQIISIEMIDAEKLQESYLAMESDIVIEEKKPEPIPEKTIKEDDCKNFFGGIGVSWDWQTDKVTEVYSGYPASQAGIQVGDILIPVGQADIRGEIGTPLTISVNRNGQIFYVNVIRAKICMDMPKPKEP